MKLQNDKKEEEDRDEEFSGLTSRKNRTPSSFTEKIDHPGTTSESENEENIYNSSKQITKTCEEALEKGRFHEALSGFIDPLLSEGKESLLLFRYKGIFLALVGKNEEALQFFDKVLEKDPNDFVSLDNKASVLFNLGMFKEAIEWYTKELEINPEHEGALYNKGLALDILGEYDNEIESYDKALEINPECEYALYNKGLALDNLGNYDEEIK